MKRIVLAAITCLSLLVALPAVSAAHSSTHHAGRDHRPDDRGDHPDRRGDGNEGERRDRLERVSCEAMNRDFSSHDAGSGSGDNGNRGGNGDNGDNGDRGDQNNDPSCVAMLQQPGTMVHDAELDVSRGNAVWDEVELGL